MSPVHAVVLQQRVLVPSIYHRTVHSTNITPTHSSPNRDKPTTELNNIILGSPSESTLSSTVFIKKT